jgi:hypothetical protein
MVGAPVIRFRTEPTAADVVWNAAGLVRRSRITLLLGGFNVALGLVMVVREDLIGLAFVVLGLTFLTGLFAAPFVWFSIRQRRELVLAPADFEVSPERLVIRTAIASSDQDWSVYRHADETDRAFVLHTGIGAAVLVIKRGIPDQALSDFRVLLARLGLMRGSPGVAGTLRRAGWAVLGAVAALAIVFGPLLIGRIGATAAIDLQPRAQGSRVVVDGTTDLPDGAGVVVSVIQLDGWERDGADGVAPDREASPWVIDVPVLVADGRFRADVGETGWPAGRAVAVAYFWVDPTQPPVVVERFGSGGQRLRGPGVRDGPGGPTLEVYQPFRIGD